MTGTRRRHHWQRPAKPRPLRHPLRPSHRRTAPPLERQPPCQHAPDEPAAARCQRCQRPICRRCARLEGLRQLCPHDAHYPDHVTVSPRWFPATFAVLAVNIGMLLVASVRSGRLGLLEPDPYQLCRLGGLNASAVLGPHHEYWRLLGAVALHANGLHLAVNTYGLLLFAPALEEAFGRWRFLLVYVAAGLVGAAASLAVYHPRLAVGASGAIFGLAGALIVLFHQFRVGIGPGVWLYTAALVAVSLLLSAVHPGVDNAAHLGGVLAGLTVGWLLVSRRPWGTAAAVVVPSVAVVVLVVWAAAPLTSAPGGEPTCLALLF